MKSSQRTFYYSPSATPKVTRDALYLLPSVQIERQALGGETVFLPIQRRFLSLESLRVDLKLEFNQSHRGLYGVEPGPVVLAHSTHPPRPLT